LRLLETILASHYRFQMLCILESDGAGGDLERSPGSRRALASHSSPTTICPLLKEGVITILENPLTRMADPCDSSLPR
jgi:hypothetical protein